MRVAQRLYENGYITYMRTDSTTLSESALAARAARPRELYGAEYVPDAPRRYDAQGQERAGGARGDPPVGRHASARPARWRGELSRDELALYDLIWKRTVASQMADARGQTATVRLGAAATDGRDAEFSATGTVITFRGFLAAYEEGRDEDRPSDDERRAPAAAAGGGRRGDRRAR